MVLMEYHQIDNFLDSFADYSMLNQNGLEPINTLDDLPRIIRKYKRKITEATEKQGFDKFSLDVSTEELLNIYSQVGTDENYTHNIGLPNGDFYNLSWSIPKAEKIVKKHKLGPISFKINHIECCIAPGAVNKSSLDLDIVNEKPIFIVELDERVFMERPPYIIIDGNHRLACQSLRGDEEIKGYLLSKDIQHEAFLGELDLKLYQVQCNIHIIMDYLFNYISKSEMKKRLIPIK